MILSLIKVISYLVLLIFIYFYKQTFSFFLIEKNNLFEFYITFLAFQSTSFAILFNSNVVHNLYKIIDKKTNLTLKHILKNYYKNSFNCLIISIIYIIISNFINNFLKNLNLEFIDESNIFLMIYFFINNIYLICLCNNFLYKIFIKEEPNI
jgi:hypothetical protein